jgi:hypothetical protein
VFSLIVTVVAAAFIRIVVRPSPFLNDSKGNEDKKSLTQASSIQK